ncbi:MAG: hypothetical protein IIC01_05070 [Planctomycetes bacterium]|nr:hypothetical protein [Planctomycetota bacterium]
MAQENPNRFSDWLLLARKQAPILYSRARDWVDAVREEPSLIWRTPAVRYAVYGLAGVIVLSGAMRLMRAFVPPPPKGAQAAATSGDFHVVCTDPECETHFVIHRPFGFDDFPVSCPTCRKHSGAQARRCDSLTCRGRWVAPVSVDHTWKCARCGRRIE